LFDLDDDDGPLIFFFFLDDPDGAGLDAAKLAFAGF